MYFTSEQIDERLQFFSELMSYNAPCFLWTYSPEGDLLSTNCPKTVLNRFFQNCGCYQYMMEHSKVSKSPLLMSGAMGLLWGAVFEHQNDQLERIHVLGPVHTQTIDNVNLEQVIWGKTDVRWKPKYKKIMEMLPVISMVMFTHRIMMMQYCLTNERILLSDIAMQNEPDDASLLAIEHDGGVYADRTQVHMAQRAMLNMVRNGDSNYHEVLTRSSRFISGHHRVSRDPVQHMKLGQVQFIALCCEAAIEGGLSPEIAYNRKDNYVRDVENAKSISDIVQTGRTMYEDYIRLVHNHRVNNNYSRVVRSTCDYIENHLEESLSADVLAQRVGYADYYLSRLFKKETGFGIDEYTRNARIERAKNMLANTTDTIQQIAEALGFGGRSYFSVVFKSVTGIPPAAYRKQHQKL